MTEPPTAPGTGGGMRVLLEGEIYNHQRHGGITRLFNRLLPALCAEHPDLTIEVLCAAEPAQDPPAHDRILHRPFAFRPLILPLRSITYPLSSWLSRRRYRSAVVSAAGKDPRACLWHSTYYSVLERWPGPTVTTVYDMAFEHFPELFRSARNRRLVARKAQAIRRADAVICISEATRADVLRFTGIPKAKTQVVYPAVDETFLRPPDEEAREEGIHDPYLLYVGNRSLTKSFATLLKGYGRWTRKNEIALVVVGRDLTAMEAALAERTGAASGLRVVPPVDDGELARLYAGARALVYPSLYEGFGFPPLEALACGCPVVASRIPSTVETAGDLPFYFEPEDPEGLSRALDHALESRDPERRRRGRQRAEAFSWTAAAEQTLEVYRRCWDRRTAAP